MSDNADTKTVGPNSQRAGRLAPLLAAGSAVTALVSCVGTCFPAIAATAGAGALLVSLGPWLFATSLVLLAGGLGLVYGARRLCAMPSRTSIVLLWVAAVIITVIIAEWLPLA